MTTLPAASMRRSTAPSGGSWLTETMAPSSMVTKPRGSTSSRELAVTKVAFSIMVRICGLRVPSPSPSPAAAGEGTLLKHRRLIHLGRERVEGALHDLAPQTMLLFRARLGRAQRVDDAIALHDAVRADHLGYGSHGAYLRDRKAGLLQLGSYRCAAASARASGAGQDDCVDASLLEVIGDAAAQPAAVVHRVGEPGGGDELVVQLTDAALALQLAGDVQRHQAVRVLLDVAVVVAAMRHVVASRFEPILDPVGGEFAR